MTSSDRHSESAKGALAEFSSSVERLFLSHGSEILDSVYNFSLTNHDQSARVLYTLPRTHRSQESQDADNIIQTRVYKM